MSISIENWIFNRFRLEVPEVRQILVGKASEDIILGILEEAVYASEVDVAKWAISFYNIDPSYENNLLMQICRDNVQSGKNVNKMISMLLSYKQVDPALCKVSLPILTNAILRRNRELIEILFYDPRIYYLGKGNYLAAVCAFQEIVDLQAMIIYDPITPRDNKFIMLHRDILSKLKGDLFKVAVTMHWLPAPLIIEIVDGLVDWAYLVPYHVKWNMVCAVKHPRWKKIN